MANMAISDPITDWNFFTTGFQSSWYDDGGSLTWYLAFTAGMAGGNPLPPQATPLPLPALLPAPL